MKKPNTIEVMKIHSLSKYLLSVALFFNCSVECIGQTISIEKKVIVKDKNYSLIEDDVKWTDQGSFTYNDISFTSSSDPSVINISGDQKTLKGLKVGSTKITAELKSDGETVATTTFDAVVPVTVYFFNREGTQDIVNDLWAKAYLEYGSSLNSVLTDVLPVPKDGYIFDGWFDLEGNYMVYDASGESFLDAGWARWKYNDNGEIVWNGTSDVLKLYPDWTKSTSTVSVKSIYSDGMTTVDGNTVSCIENDHRYVGASVDGLGINTVKGYQGNCYLTTNGIDFLTDEPNDPQTLLSKTIVDGPHMWQLTRVSADNADDVYIMSLNKGGYLYKMDGGGLGLSTSATTVWTISRNGFIHPKTDDVSKAINLQKVKNQTIWRLESAGIQSQDRPLKVVEDLTSTNVISALKAELSKEAYRYTVNEDATDENIFKGLLYVDISSAGNVTESTENKWSDFQEKTAANCLFFMPESYNTSSLTKNVVAKQSGGTYAAMTNFVLTDIDPSYEDGYTNPFYSPYQFTVGGELEAKYERQISSQISQTSSLMLPFSVKLTDGVSPNTGVGFYAISRGDMSNPNNCILDATHIDGNAAANTPYHVRNDNGAENISIAEKETTVEATEVKEYENNMNSWTAYSNYFGKRQSKSVPDGTQYYYYNGGLYFNSSCTGADYVCADPYRAYFIPGGDWAHVNAKSYRVVFEGDASGIESTTVEPTGSESIYTISGVKVNGKPQQRGIYIVNGKKQIF